MGMWLKFVSSIHFERGAASFLPFLPMLPKWKKLGAFRQNQHKLAKIGKNLKILEMILISNNNAYSSSFSINYLLSHLIMHFVIVLEKYKH